MSRHTTLNDLARQLGLSPSTVSRALRDHPDISPSTKERVMAMAEEMHYQPNLMAQNLQKRGSNTIGVIIPEIRNTFFSTVIGGIEEISYEAGYTIMVCQSADTFSREVMNIKALASHRVAGMLVSISQQTETYAHLEKVMRQGIPLVLFDRVAENLTVNKVVVDDHDGAYAAVSHLIERGRRRIAHLGGTGSMSVSKKRREGYLAALNDHGLEVSPQYMVEVGYHEEDGWKGMARLLRLSPRPDAIFAVNDPVAIGAFLCLEEQGIRIPDDVAIVGYSNNPNSSLVRPRLTTVNQPAFEIGQRAAMLLLGLLQKPLEEQEVETVVLLTELIVRESS